MAYSVDIADSAKQEFRNALNFIDEVHEHEKQARIISFLHARQDITWHITRDYELLD